MTVRLKPIKYQTLVITGAGSDIGLATARAAAARRAKCVLVDRDESKLNDLVAEIRRTGGSAAYAIADAADTKALHGVTQTAVEQFGGYDSWINIAGAADAGSWLDADPGGRQQAFETNFWGVVNGCLEAAHHLRQRTGQYGGAIVNLGGLVSDRAAPSQDMDATSNRRSQALPRHCARS